MAVPTITTLTPALGPSMGRTLVDIAGTNFQLPPAPVATGPVPTPPPTVEVLFGTDLATNIKVISVTRILCLNPINDPVATDVTVRNIDSLGVVIPGETVTLTDGFAYARPNLAVTQFLLHVTARIAEEIKRQVIDNVSITTHVDWDDSPADGLGITAISGVPAIVVSGPNLEQNRFFSVNALRFEPAGAGRFRARRLPRTEDVGFTIIGIDDNTQRLINLQHLMTVFMRRNPILKVRCDPSDPGSNLITYELDIQTGGDFSVDSRPNSSNLRNFSGDILVRGVDLEAIAEFSDDSFIDESVPVSSDGVTLEAAQQSRENVVDPFGNVTAVPVPIPADQGAPLKSPSDSGGS